MVWHHGWHPFLCVRVPVRESLCLFWLETHTKCLCARSPTRPEGQGKEGPGYQSDEISVKRRAVSRREQQRPVDRTGQSGRLESDREETSQQKSEKHLLGPVDLQMPGWSTRGDNSASPVALWEFSLEYTFALAQRMYKKCHRPPPLLRLKLTQVCVCSFVLFFFPLSCTLRICKEIWNTPGQRWEKPLDESLAMSGLRKMR